MNILSFGHALDDAFTAPPRRASKPKASQTSTTERDQRLVDDELEAMIVKAVEAPTTETSTP